jgi:hypothetical protein
MPITHLLVESVSAFREALHEFPQKEVTWYTSTPMVVETLSSEGHDVRWLEDFLAEGVPDRIGYTAFDVVHAMVHYVDELGRKKGIPDAHRFAALPLQRLIACLLYKQSVLNAWIRVTGPSRIVVGDPLLSPPAGGNPGIDRFDTLFAVLASRGHSDAVRILEVEQGKRVGLYKDIDRMPPMDRLLSSVDLSPHQLLYRFLRYGAGTKGIPGKRGTPRVRILRDNELIRESLPHLLRQSAAVCFEKPLQTRRDDAPLFDPELDGVLDGAVRHACEGRGLDLEEFSSIVPIVADRLRSVSRFWRPCYHAARRRVSRWETEKNPQILISNTLAGPGNVALSLAAQERGIPVCIVEHGVSAGISHFHEPLRPFSEVSHCDLYLASSRNAVDFNDREPRIRGKSVAVGLASQVRRPRMRWVQRIIARKRLGAGRRERVVMFLTRACQNNIRLIPHSPEDRDVHGLERVMARKVMPRVRGIPVIKYYNTRRHWDPHPFVGPFRAPAPVRTVQVGDFRFLRAGVDVMILQTPLSTLGWAFGTGKPVFYVEQPELRLLPHVREAMAEAVFLFSTEDVAWEEALLDAINRPDEEIAGAWHRKEEARARFLKQFVFGPPGAASKLAEIIQSRAVRSHSRRHENRGNRSR